FSEMLQTWSWTWFMTWTFEDCVGPQKALIEVRRHLEFIAWGAKGEIGYIAGLEQEYDAPSPHAHGLIIGGERLYMEPYWRAWLDRNGRGRFERVRSIGAVLYCSKLSTKGSELILSDNLGRFRPDTGQAPERPLPFQRARSRRRMTPRR